MIQIDLATSAGVRWVAHHLHPADDVEIVTVSGGWDAPSAVVHMVQKAGTVFEIRPVLDGVPSDRPVAIFGVEADRQNEGWGIVWLLSTPMLPTTSIDLIKEAPKWFNTWLSQYPKGLHNMMDARNTRHQKWIKKMGAQFDPQRSAKINGEPFLYFSITNKVPSF